MAPGRARSPVPSRGTLHVTVSVRPSSRPPTPQSSCGRLFAALKTPWPSGRVTLAVYKGRCEGWGWGHGEVQRDTCVRGRMAQRSPVALGFRSWLPPPLRTCVGTGSQGSRGVLATVTPWAGVTYVHPKPRTTDACPPPQVPPPARGPGSACDHALVPTCRRAPRGTKCIFLAFVLYQRRGRTAGRGRRGQDAEGAARGRAARRAALQCAAPVIDRHARRRAAGQSAGRRARRP